MHKLVTAVFVLAAVLLAALIAHVAMTQPSCGHVHCAGEDYGQQPLLTYSVEAGQHVCVCSPPATMNELHHEEPAR